ncbi:hypothetical protein QTI51_03995 [Variovorax sp. J22G73]|uniref:hypothetical protein n=1 Tax=unclassified Variovorax TaxID=663243 RepID=UPI002576F7C8|nr:MULTISPECIES: hypothetical protein [unclassified Variovorax]MDM0003910.1 hypothetical protein [Variovorax sp. J22R203]MDM0096424.1 hypothetical protein [Variovorax sp. J22G73]
MSESDRIFTTLDDAPVARQVPICVALPLDAHAVGRLAERWAEGAGHTLRFRADLTPARLALMPAAERALLSASCELYDLLAASAEGLAALDALGLVPLAAG